MTSPAKHPQETPGLGEVIAELYALLPSDFTAARNARSAAAGRDGNKDLAQRIKRLPKPSMAAWLVNLLAHRRREELDGVLELGAALREAQEDLDQKQLRRLSVERQRLLRAIIRDARELAAELDHPVSEGIAAEAEQTLWAAMADAAASDVVASGQLVRSLQASGWEEVELQDAVADAGSVKHGEGFRPGRGRGPDAGTSGQGTPGKSAVTDSAAARRRRAAAERAVEKARQHLEEAEAGEQEAQDALDAAQRDVEETAARRDDLTDEIDELRERIRTLEREVASVDRQSGGLERVRDNARRTARAARRAAEKARQKLTEASQTAETEA